VNVNNLFLFILVCVVSGALMFLGIIIGDASGTFEWSLGVAVGGVVGTGIAVLLAARYGLLEGATWNAVSRVSIVGVGIVAGIASAYGLSRVWVAVAGTLGSGVGALIGKFLARAFLDEPPPSIL